MNQSVSRWFMPLLLVWSLGAAWSAEDVPLLSELRKPVEVKVEETEEEPVLPAAVSPGNRIDDLSRLCPPEPVWYLAVPDASKLEQNWEASPLGFLMNDPSMIKAFQNNRFGLNFLFSDLPASIIAPERVIAISSILELAQVVAGQSQKMALAGYIDEQGDFSFLFLFDVGLDRIPAFEVMADWETSFLVTNPGTAITRGDHAGNFLDSWKLRQTVSSMKAAEVVAGFAENILIISNNPALAQRSFDLLGGGESLSASNWGQRLNASITASGSTDIVGFVRMDALLKGLDATPIAKDSVAGWADLIGHGGNNGEAIYYGLQFTGDGSRETFLLPTAGPAGSASLIELVAKRLRASNEWIAPQVVPYQPNPSLYVAAKFDGKQLGGLLRQDRRLFGLSEREDSFEVPPAVRPIFTNEIATLLTGEIGMAFFQASTVGDPSPWLMVLPCTGNPETLLGRATTMIERSGAMIRSQEQDWRKNPAWVVATPDKFHRLDTSFLLIASAGDLLISAVDQMVAGSSFASNKDFVSALATAEENQGMLFYINVPEVLVREYPNLSYIMRSLYPRSSGLNSRPPLSLLRRYAKGLLGITAPVGDNAEFTRVTVQSPVPAMGALSTGMVLSFPRSLRWDGRMAMTKSRENMQNLWLRLQLYSSRYGHFPESLQDLAADMRMNTPEAEIQSMLIAPAALSRMSPEEAMAHSYNFLSGVTPNDEPDIPLIYEGEPWSEDFMGLYPTAANRAPAESGDYVPFRQYIRLDGTVVIMPEKTFQNRVVNRLTERE